MDSRLPAKSMYVYVYMHVCVHARVLISRHKERIWASLWKACLFMYVCMCVCMRACTCTNLPPQKVYLASLWHSCQNWLPCEFHVKLSVSIYCVHTHRYTYIHMLKHIDAKTLTYTHIQIISISHCMCAYIYELILHNATAILSRVKGSKTAFKGF